MQHRLAQLLADFLTEEGLLTVLTGAGVSAESGIPTFRGKEGYWTVGSQVYHPQEMATLAMFGNRPLDVWAWYLYRRRICSLAAPNAGHKALAEMEKLLGERFLLITQNVDGLHIRAGSSPARTYQIHGNLNFMRCSAECTPEVYPIPESLRKERDENLVDAEAALLVCPRCGVRSRPHVLWFDECYDETRYRYKSSLDAAGRTGLLIVAGTSGATNLPLQVASEVQRRGGNIVDINTEREIFSDLAERTPRGIFLRGPTGELLPMLCGLLQAGS